MPLDDVVGILASFRVGYAPALSPANSTGNLFGKGMTGLVIVSGKDHFLEATFIK